jgi:hypothetical protein
VRAKAIPDGTTTRTGRIGAVTNDCGHDGPPSTTRLCPHVAEDGEQAFVGVLTTWKTISTT